MGIFKALFGGGDAADNNENIRKADESFEEYASRIKDRTKVKAEDVTLENLDKLNTQAALDAGIITPDQYLSERRKQHFKNYYNELDEIANKRMPAKQTEEEPKPCGDWFIDNDGFMKRPWSDGSLRRE